MKKSLHRAICFLFAVLVIAMCFPFSAFAVDPVSAGIMANAFAQAIAAYGASNGVAMTFDVSSTDGIGESVHELWKQFRDGTQSADDYATLAAALFPELYYKASVAVGAAADVYTVGYNISSTYAEEFDNFYNWLLTGPAEMVKVDNEYFQFSSAQIGPEATPINVVGIGGSFDGQPYSGIPNFNSNSYQNYNQIVSAGNLVATGNRGGAGLSTVYFGSASDLFLFFYPTGGSYNYVLVSPSQSTFVGYFAYGKSTNYTFSSEGSITAYGSLHYLDHWLNAFAWGDIYAPVYPSLSDGLNAINSWLNNPAYTDTIGVKSYDSTGVAEFPDTSDPNYEAVAKQIPSTYPWDDALYGDGTGTLTDAQSGAIAADAAGVLATDGVIPLAEAATADPDGPGGDDDPSSDPDDYLAVGLEDIFPFCIPFDIYNFLSALAAEPVAPHFTASLAFPQSLGGTQTIEIDFDSPTWNQLAQLLRLLELLAFIVGLALLTRSMFIRG